MRELRKSKTGIKGFDSISKGGLPTGRPSLVCGMAGSGKTLFGIEFIVKGITIFNESGVIISFEERAEDLVANAASLGWDLQEYIDKKKLAIDYIYIERSEIEETGFFNLDGLFIRIAEAVRVTGARRILIDTMESLFSGFTDEQILRAEIRRLFRWLKEKGLTAVVTAETGVNKLTRHGLEEYLSDFVMVLDNRIKENVSTRRIRLVKYRGSSHDPDEFPFVITPGGFSILPLTDISLNYAAPEEYFLTGIEKLDEMLDSKGIYRGSALLISGTSGSGKTSVAASILNAVCQRGEKVVYVSFEESKDQIIRNMGTIGMDIGKYNEKGLFHLLNFRTVSYGVEMHLINIIDWVETEKPSVIVFDPLSSLSDLSTPFESQSLVLRTLHYIKSKGITCIFTELSPINSLDISKMGISYLMDYWISLNHTEFNNYRMKTLNIIKARGMKHSDQICELVMSEKGISLRGLPGQIYETKNNEKKVGT